MSGAPLPRSSFTRGVRSTVPAMRVRAWSISSLAIGRTGSIILLPSGNEDGVLRLRIRFRKIERVMQPATFVPRKCASDDEVRDLDQIAELDEIRRHPEMLVIVGDFLAKQVDPVLRPLQPLRRPDDPDVVPHEATDLA